AWSEAVQWIFGIDTALHRVKLGEVVSPADFFSRSDFDLFFDQIKISHFLSDRMFYLNSGIHFHKVEVPMLIHQKFDGASTFIAYCFRAFNGRSAHFFAKFISNERGGGFFYKFLMTDRKSTRLNSSHVKISY